MRDPLRCPQTNRSKPVPALDRNLAVLRDRLDALEGVLSELYRLPGYDRTIGMVANLRAALEARTAALALAQYILAASSLGAAQEAAQRFLEADSHAPPDEDRRPGPRLERAAFAIEQTLDNIAATAADVSLISLAHRLELEDLLIDGHDFATALESFVAAISRHTEAESAASA